MKFLVNPECYHKMCESCVARIFTLGPAPCPICGRQLRRNKFRAQTFSDIHIEREIDTRRRLQKVFNKSEEDFDSLAAYNDYLEEVEMITFNLTQGVDVEATERKVRSYENANKASISANEARDAAEHALALETEKLAKEARNEQARQAQEALLREKVEQEERAAELLSAMESGADYERVKKEIMRNSMKRLEASKKQASDALSKSLKHIKSMQQSRLQALRKEAEVPFSPMLGQGVKTDLYVVREEYDDPFLSELRSNKAFSSGGGRIGDIYERALFEAFAGLMQA